ncbi:hypothetical protein BFJ68_g242 [Fusarium oxysporum]|uniref:Amidase domain-containing protein n=1 Tax=Fusarium oxysporum TaxID=5507 RepID=A0A420S8L3_FUSOX|nr:hypothetical protein BFJ68_g242 [Fusarium oxysporum]
MNVSTSLVHQHHLSLSIFHLRPNLKGTIQETINPDALIPITLLSTEEIFGDLEGILQLFDSIDDVFVPDFGSILVEKSGDNSSQVQVDTRQIYHMDQIKALDGFSELPSGPYFLYGPNLYQAWRLYDDEFGAFTSGVIPDDLNQPDENASSSTAKYAQSLIDQGAIIVGKTKISHLGAGAEWVDQQAPWSARGDGYYRMEGGSVGAAAASAGHSWIDYSIGVDGKSGHCEKPRLTVFDKTRIFSRSLKGLLDFTANAKAGASEASSARIIVPDDLSSPEKSQKTAIATFVSILQDLLDTKVEYINVGKIWEKSPPSEASNEGMQAYMQKQKFDKKPFVEATPQFFWNECKSVTEEENRQDTERLGVYRKWFRENIMRTSTPNAKGDAVVILPCGKSQVEHRNDPVAHRLYNTGADIGGFPVIVSMYPMSLTFLE